MKTRLIELGLTRRRSLGPGIGKIHARTAARLAWSVWALCLPLTALGSMFGLLYALALDRTAGVWVVLFSLLLLTFPTVGAVIVSRQPRNPIGWIFCAEGLVGSAVFLAQAYADYALEAASRPLPGTEYAYWFANCTMFPTLFLGATMLFLLFPDGRLPSPLVLWRPVAWTAVIGALINVLGEAFGPETYYSSHVNPSAVGGALGNLLELLAGFGFPLLALAFLASMGSPLVRLYRATGQERQQLKWFVYVAAMTTLSVVMGSIFASEAPGSLGYVLNGVFWHLMIVGLLLLPIATAIAILRHRLYDIDRIINRTLVYGALTAIVVGGYVLAVGSLGSLLQTGTDGNLAISILVTGLVAVLFQPLRSRLQRTANRLMYGQRDEPYEVISRLGRRLEGTLVPEVALSTIVETIVQALKLPYAAIALRQDGRFVTAAEHGNPTGEPATLPLVYNAEEVGKLVVASRTASEELTPADRQLLEGIAHQAGAAVHAARLTADLQRSRERLVTTREEERRRLRRDLHDGVGPQLAALMLELETAGELVSDNAEASALMAKLSERTRETVADVRRSVHALRPPALDELDLVGALREAAAVYSRKDLDVSVEAPEELPPLPAAVEVACYRIAQEAMTNAVRHAQASNCRVRLALDDEAGTLRVEVQDDGIGITDKVRAGVGMSSMRERAEELGGSCTVGLSAAGGTLVSALLPCTTAKDTDRGEE